ncbi:uncharacterized protein TM35_000211990 [Trypanosoma theileri]|uniref:Opioid growth factor receptor (OGFr) conserved domain-containing protein n=1 Tax=Trypanosoma theileri TaxID=67003 RepID=A0A1X0NT07_9TRYP|nr:uncharacterized protein TM35_000211990 [Trypanosoma theileri]ORC87593.1 hypothetical protein TM35_000211990 [Trypanosoma theileri]
MYCSEVTSQPLLTETEDIETLLTTLREKANAAAAAAGDCEEEEKEKQQQQQQQREHPSVSFYRGYRSVKVQLPIQENSPLEKENISSSSFCCFHVIGLHQALLPPSQGGVQFTEEERSAQLSSSDGLELLRVNWELLLWLLMPTVRIEFLSIVKEEMNLNRKKEEKVNVKGDNDDDDDVSTPICSLQELLTPLMWKDYTQLREPGMMDRVHYSYVVFIRFYGWRIHNEESGVLDRHQNWKERYKILLENCKENNNKQDDNICCGLKKCCFYSALTHILRVLLDLCFTRYAINLVAFMLEEMRKGRLLRLQSSLEKCWLPQVIECKQVPVSEKERLQRQLYRLTHSDSD